MNDFKQDKDMSNSEEREWDSSPTGGSRMGADDYYFNSDGLVVLTAKYLLERGYCCGNGCKNCPYDYKAVPEPRRSRLLAERKQNESNNDASEKTPT